MPFLLTLLLGSIKPVGYFSIANGNQRRIIVDRLFTIRLEADDWVIATIDRCDNCSGGPEINSKQHFVSQRLKDIFLLSDGSGYRNKILPPDIRLPTLL